ncbi:MAG: tetratricopeptide repeat protein [Phycisphaerae bacterium]
MGQVIDKLKRLGVYDSTLIIITADHGESLGEHGESKHGYFIYHSTTKVPLIVKRPGRTEAGRIENTVGLVDIVPTVLAQLSLPMPAEVQGQDLSGFLSGKAAGEQERYIYSESMTPTRYGLSSLLGVQTHHWKYIQTTRPELYDLTLDPGEMNDLAGGQPQRALRLQGHLKKIPEDHLRTRADESQLALDQESVNRLRALGYTGGSVDEAFEFDTDKEDPKGFIDIFTKIESVDFYVDTRDHAKAKRICAEILAVQPDVAYIHSMLGRMAIGEGNYAQATTHYTRALELNPDDAGWHNNLGRLLSQQGRLDEAIEHYTTALQLAFGAADGASDVDRVFAAQGHIDPLVFGLHCNLGNALLAQGKLADAVREYREAARIDPTNADVHYQIGIALSGLDRWDEAIKAYREALRLDPGHAAARRALDTALSD